MAKSPLLAPKIIPEAPIDGTLYGRQDAAWEPVIGMQGPEGPEGPGGIEGPEGAPGAPGTSTILIGQFGASKTPADLPPDGMIPVDWDSPGQPQIAHQMLVGESLIYQPINTVDLLYGHLFSYTSVAILPSGWLDVGAVAGPPGPAGAQGPVGPQGPAGAQGPAGPGIGAPSAWTNLSIYSINWAFTGPTPRQRSILGGAMAQLQGNSRLSVAFAANARIQFVAGIPFRPPVTFTRAIACTSDKNLRAFLEIDTGGTMTVIGGSALPIGTVIDYIMEFSII